MFDGNDEDDEMMGRIRVEVLRSQAQLDQAHAKIRTMFARLQSPTLSLGGTLGAVLEIRRLASGLSALQVRHDTLAAVLGVEVEPNADVAERMRPVLDEIEADLRRQIEANYSHSAH
jgi:division protein CdvB (Snf7/Vps24/ESCRT-III family)